MLDWLARFFGRPRPQTTAYETEHVQTFHAIEPAQSSHEQEARSQRECASLEGFENTPSCEMSPPVEEVEHTPAAMSASSASTVSGEVALTPASSQFAAFNIHSLAGGRVFARFADSRLAHQPSNTAPEGWEVHGFVTDAHPDILFVLADGRPIAINGEHDLATVHAFRIEESDQDAFALFDLTTEAYLAALHYEDGVNTFANDRKAVRAWEMFHLVAAGGVTPADQLPLLLPSSGTSISAEMVRSWARPDAGTAH